jgi:ComEC/Rec2-related protein
LCLLVFTVFMVRHEIDWHRNPGRLPIDLLSQGIDSIRAAGIVTSDPLPAGFAKKITRTRFEMRVTSLTYGTVRLKARFPMQVYWAGAAPQWGDKVQIAGDILQIAPARNPGEFSPAQYLARRGIFAELSCEYPADCTVLAHGKGNPLLAWARGARAALQGILTRGIEDDPEAAGLVQTITLGLKQETSIADRDLFQHVGALHLFVVNGLHVAMLAAILGMLLKFIAIPRRVFAAIIIPILFAYALLTGLNAGSVRAAIMGAVIFGASFVDRRPFSFNTLAATALILLLWDTNDAFQVGFQFSFTVVAVIIGLTRWINRPIVAIGVPDSFLPRRLWNVWNKFQNWGWRRVAGLAAVSLAASIGSLPLTAGYFNLITPSGFFANLLLVPLALLILANGLFSLLTCWSGLPILFNNSNWLLAHSMLGLVHLFSSLPGGYFYVSTVPGLPACRVTVLDLAPGQAVVIQSHGAAWLVDCGSHYTYERTVRPFLQSQGINRLDGFIVTHGASGTIGGFQELIEDFSPRTIYESALADKSVARRQMNDYLAAKAIKPVSLKTGDTLSMGGEARCAILYPPPGSPAGKAADKSLVLRIENGQSRALLLSDSGFAGEHWLLDHGQDVRAAVVVIGGQSADLMGGSDFISASHPQAVVRGQSGYGGSVAADRRWAGGVYREAATPFLQAATGAVTMELRPDRVTLTGFVNGQRLVHAW